MSKTALVTGGAGFIGSHITRALLERGIFVRIVDSDPKKVGTISGGGLEYRCEDLADFQVADHATRDIEFVFHQAARASVAASVEDPFATQESGETATLLLLQACIKNGVRRVMFAASSSAYGDSVVLPFSESMPPSPMSPYAASKLACEHYMRAYSKCFGLETISLRYFNVFGEGQSSDSPYSGVVAKFLSSMRKGERPVIYGDGMQTRDFTHVKNVVDANLLAMNCKQPLNGLACNIGCGEQISVKTLVDELNFALGRNIEPIFEAHRAGDPWNSCASIDLARKILGYEPKINFSKGIRRLVNE